MSFVKAADTVNVPENKAIKVIVGGKEILISNISGSYYAIPDKCPHMGGSLSEGILSDGIITCPKHGARFDVKTGKAVGNAKLAFLKIKVNDSVTYPVKIDEGAIMVDIG
jgi:3-phenylpropionate/trans-cinnamate dioxygenase ferredoxin component